MRYEEIKFEIGSNIESAVSELHRLSFRGGLVCGSFNGHMLYSDIDTVDSAYIKIIGKTKAKFDEGVRKDREKDKAEDRKYKESIPRLTELWITKGNAVLNDKFHGSWARIVPIRLNGIYRGLELGACLDIIEKLDVGCEMSEAKSIITNQYHSGASFSLVCILVSKFSDRGDEFIEFINK